MLLTESLRYHARVSPRDPAVTWDGGTVDFAGLVDLVARAAAVVRQHVEPGGQAGLSLGTTLEHVVLLFATAVAGVTAVELDPKWSDGEIRHALTTFDLGLVVTDSDDVAATVADGSSGTCSAIRVGGGPTGLDARLVAAAPLRDWTKLDGAADHVISPAGGTSGRMKGICISHDATAERFHSQMVEFGVPRDGAYLAATPLFHGGARSLGLGYLYFGGSIHLMDRFDVEPFVAATHRTTASFVVPTMLQRLLEHGQPLHPGFRVICGGSLLDPGLVDAVLDRITVNLFDYYASVDTGPISVLKPGDIASHRASVGRPAFGVFVEIDHPGPDGFGDVLISGRTLSSRYVGDVDPEVGRLLAEDRVARLGDIGRIDDEGFLHLRGRNDDVIITGGVNVSALEVEAAIGRLAGVDRVVVVGVPSDEWGQEVVAGIVWREGARDRDAVAGELAGALSRVKIPKRIVALDDIPLTSIGKVNRRGSLDLIVRGLEQS